VVEICGLGKLFFTATVTEPEAGILTDAVSLPLTVAVVPSVVTERVPATVLGAEAVTITYFSHPV